MMNGREKSDSAIVAMKPANKAGEPAAEWAEPRAGTKGNTGQSHTHRAQNRASVLLRSSDNSYASAFGSLPETDLFAKVSSARSKGVRQKKR